MTRYCFALDLKDDPNLIAEYDRWHQQENGWPEIRESIIGADILMMEIYRIANRLFMIMEVSDQFSLANKAKLDAANPKVKEWEELMWRFQQPLPWASDGEKWLAMKKIFELQASAISYE